MSRGSPDRALRAAGTWEESPLKLRAIAALSALIALGSAHAQTGPAGSLNTQTIVTEDDRGQIYAIDVDGGHIFADYTEYLQSRFFTQNDMRCGVGKLFEPPFTNVSTSDCNSSNTTAAAQYEPNGGTHYVIPVVVHVLQRKNNAGAVSDSLINSQIDVLNEDFQALAGSLGAPGTDVNISFVLAGVTRSKNNSWYNDSGTYYNSLAWDTTKYLNIYTNLAGGNLGYAYVPSSGGVVGNSWDRVVIYWRAFGRNAPIGPPYNQGRTLTHEVGHYLGLYHTFDGGCASASGCANNGDLICDTNPESGPMGSGSCSRTTCSSSDPVDNYMDYSDDICMDRFTPIQANRMRCTIENFRVDLPQGGGSLPGKASGPSPSNGSTGVSTSANLSWSAGNGATSNDVYFGTDSTPDAGEAQGNQSGTSFDPGSLAASTTYYWRIDSVNATGTTTGDVWSFTTAGGGGGGINLSANGFKVKGKWHADLTWSGANGGTIEIYRDGNFLTSTANDGQYQDATSFKGGGSMTYMVCEIGGSPCSNNATANF